MSKQTELRFDLSGLDNMVKNLKGFRTRVGVLGDNAIRVDHSVSGTGSDMTNAELAAIQIFGSHSANIPPRDFLMMPIEKNEREIINDLAKASSFRSAVTGGNVKKAFEILGAKAEEYVQKAFESGGFGLWEPNAASTIARKGSSAPLIDTGQLRRAVTSDVVKAGDKGT